MKKSLSLILFCFFYSIGYCQSDKDTTVKLDLLKAPSSPASNLLGFATSDIEKPTDVSAFMLSLQSASGSFSKLPSNYAVDIAPYWLVGKRTDFTTFGLSSQKFNDIFKQSLVISFAIKNPDSSESNLKTTSTYGGLGFKFSLLRGGYNDETKKVLAEIGALQYQNIHNNMAALKEWHKNDPEYAQFNKRRSEIIKELGSLELAERDAEYIEVNKKINELQQKFADKLKNPELTKIKELAADLELIRVGWSLDVAGGISGEFINKRFDNSRLFNAGIWTIGGYTGKNGGSFLGIIRYLYNPDKVFAKDNVTPDTSNISTLDAGVRYVYSKPKSKFNCSVEAIYRSILSSNTIDPSWRLIFNAEYSFWQNQKFTFSFGRSFDGTITKDGNLIAALSFLTGFGNKR